MKTQLVTILCEGPHDVAFIAKILKTVGFESWDKLKLRDYPEPMNQVFISEAQKTNIEGLNLAELRQNLLPSTTLKKGNDFLFLYALGGDSKKENRMKILNQLLTLIPNEGETSKLPQNTSLNIIYFFDADEIGVTNRINQLNTEVESILKENLFKGNQDIQEINGIKIGCYIFNKAGKGKLESIVLPLMKQENEFIFDNAFNFIEKNLQDKWKKDFDFEKANIGVAGQLQKSGSTNTVIIAQSDFITEDKIKNNSDCREIISYFNNFLTLP